MHLVERIRWLFESLPEPATWTPLAKFTIIRTGNCKTFAQQCVNNNNNNNNNPQLRNQRRSGNIKRATNTSGYSPLTDALSWEPLGRRYHRAITCLYMYLLIKYRLIGFISDTFGYLDCAILGRFRFIGRTNKISGEIVSIGIICLFVYQWAIHLRVPQFKFFALEFLMSRREVRDLGSETGRRNRAARSPNGRNSNADESRFVSCEEKEFKEQLCRVKRPERRTHELAAVDSIAYLRNPFNIQEDVWILRPNRTRRSWLKLSLWTKFILYYSGLSLLSMLFTSYILIGGPIVTNLGFEMSYPACVSWLRNIQSPNWAHESTAGIRQVNNYSHIYLAPRVLAHEIPIDNIPARIPMNTRDLENATLYTIVRITADILENFVVFTEFVTLFSTLFYLLAIMSLDVILNADGIKTRLLGLLVKLERQIAHIRNWEEEEEEARDGAAMDYSTSTWRNRRSHRDRASETLSFGSPRRLMPFNTSTPFWTSNYQIHQFPPTIKYPATPPDGACVKSLDRQQVQDEIVEMQAILTDHFYTITRGYNLYVSFVLSLMGFSWLLYTVILCIWMSSIRSRAVELEFVLAEAIVTIFSFTLTIGAAIVRSHNLQLYTLITRAMALDPNWSLTKPRWTTILKYFYPKPFHCFTIFGSTEISMLLGLKVR